MNPLGGLQRLMSTEQPSNTKEFYDRALRHYWKALYLGVAFNLGCVILVGLKLWDRRFIHTSADTTIAVVVYVMSNLIFIVALYTLSRTAQQWRGRLWEVDGPHPDHIAELHRKIECMVKGVLDRIAKLEARVFPSEHPSESDDDIPKTV